MNTDPKDILFSLSTRKGWGSNPDALQIALHTWTKPKEYWLKTAAQEWIIQDPRHPKSSGLPIALVSAPLVWSLGNFREPYKVIVKERACIESIMDLLVRYYISAGFDLAASNNLIGSSRIEWCVLRESYPEDLDDMWQDDGGLDWNARQVFTLWNFFSNPGR